MSAFSINAFTDVFWLLARYFTRSMISGLSLITVCTLVVVSINDIIFANIIIISKLHKKTRPSGRDSFLQWILNDHYCILQAAAKFVDAFFQAFQEQLYAVYGAGHKGVYLSIDRFIVVTIRRPFYGGILPR